MNEGKKKRIFVLLWILIIMMTYYSTTNINFSEQNVTKNKMEILEKAQSALAELGIDFQSDAQHVTIRAVPLPLRQQNLQILIPELIGYLAKQSVFEPGNIAQWIARNLMSEHAQWSMAQAITLLADVERLCPQLVKTPPGGLLQSVDLHPAIKALKDE
jgi:DNA mismatch repair protein MutL